MGRMGNIGQTHMCQMGKLYDTAQLQVETID